MRVSHRLRGAARRTERPTVRRSAGPAGGNASAVPRTRARTRRRRWRAARRGCGEWGSAAAELAAGGFRRGDARGVAARAAPAGVRRAGEEALDALPSAHAGGRGGRGGGDEGGSGGRGREMGSEVEQRGDRGESASGGVRWGQAGARRAPSAHTGSSREPGRRSRPAGAAAPRLPGARRVDARAPRGDPHPGRRQPRGASASVLRWRRVHGRVRRKRRASGRARRGIRGRPCRSHTCCSHTGPRHEWQWRKRDAGAFAAGPTPTG